MIFGNCYHKTNLIIIMNYDCAELLQYNYIYCLLYINYNKLGIIVNCYYASLDSFMILRTTNDSV